MEIINEKTKLIRDHLYPIIGETKAKTCFSYYGIFKDGNLFGLYKDNCFYLRIPEAYSTEILAQSGVTQLDAKIFGIHSKLFYLLPQHIIDNLAQYAHWLEASLLEISTLRQSQQIEKKKFIRNLPNMNIHIERMLRKIGIHSIEQFKEYGAINAFVELLKLGIIEDDVSMLFKLYGAVQHQYIYTLTPQQKHLLLTETNTALYEAGLRNRFNIID